MTIAAETRDAVRQHPFLLSALRSGVTNYTAAAEFLDLDGETESVATALRRYADDLPGYDTEPREARVTMRSGVGFAEDSGEALLTVGGVGVVPDEGESTVVSATGEVDAAVLAAVLDHLAVADVEVEGAGVTDGTLSVVVPRRHGASAVRIVEEALAGVPRQAGETR